MTDIATLQRQLREHQGDLHRIAQEIERMVPEGAGRDDLILLAANDAFAAAACSSDSATRIGWAIREREGSDGQD